MNVKTPADETVHQEACPPPATDLQSSLVAEGQDELVGREAVRQKSGPDSETSAVSDTDGNDLDIPVTDTGAVDKRKSLVHLRWSRVVVFGVLPVVALLLGLAAGWLKWQDSSVRLAELAGRQAVQVASESTVAILSYKPSDVDRELAAAESRLTGAFKDSYKKLTQDVVIPGAKQQQISAVATVPAAALVSSSSTHAVVLLAVDQTTIVGTDAPSQTASTVRVTLDKVDGRWLMSAFDPI